MLYEDFYKDAEGHRTQWFAPSIPRQEPTSRRRPTRQDVNVGRHRLSQRSQCREYAPIRVPSRGQAAVNDVEAHA
jgi:hypothetical protein